MRYIITRPCLQEGSLRILKYLQAVFAESGTVVFIDNNGEKHPVDVDVDKGRIWGLGSLYHSQHLGVNDVLMITALETGVFQVEATVKPHGSPPLLAKKEIKIVPETRRIMVSSTAYVREMRTQEITPKPEFKAAFVDTQASHLKQPAGLKPLSTKETTAHPIEIKVIDKSYARADKIAEKPTNEGSALPNSALPSFGQVKAIFAPVQPLENLTEAPTIDTSLKINDTALNSVPLGTAYKAPEEYSEPLQELARLTGYQFEELDQGVTRLTANLGRHGYSVLLAHYPQALSSSTWQQKADYRAILTIEQDRPLNVGRLTRPALVALIKHAQILPLSPVDLRGYWKAGNFDLEAVSSIVEMAKGYLEQRAIFTSVLVALGEYVPHSLIHVGRLLEQLGYTVGRSELVKILDMLTGAPFLALSPLPESNI